MAIDRTMLDTALTEAHLPSLAMATIHLTGDASLLDGDARPVYDFWGDGQGGLDAATQQRLAQEDITATPDMSAYQVTTRALVACP